VLVALLILAFGAYFARFVGNSVSAYFRNVHLQDADLLGNLARYAILAFVVLIALDQVNIGGDIVRETFLILLAGVVFALALGFGLALSLALALGVEVGTVSATLSAAHATLRNALREVER
jgi:hypothetical protein